MTTLTEFCDLVANLNTEEIWNDIRVMLPSYSYTLSLVGEQWYKYPIDIVARAVDSESIRNYGRRTKTLNKHVINKSYAEYYCESEVAKYKQPYQGLDAKIIGETDSLIVKALTMKLSDSIEYDYSPFTGTAKVDKLVLDIDLDRLPRLAIGMTDASAIDLLDWFIVGDSEIDGDCVIG